MIRSLLICAIVFLFGCAPQTKYVKSQPETSTPKEDMLSVKTKIQVLETRLSFLEKELKNLESEVKKLKEPSSTKEIILSKISELAAQQENLISYLTSINSEISDIKKRLKIKSSSPAKRLSLGARNIKKIKKAKDEAFYSECLALYRKGRYSSSISCFSKFIKKFKNSSLIPNAYFWIGDSYFKQGEFLKAIDNYDIVLTKYPDSKKVPSALLKEGLSFYYMKDKEGAKIFFMKVINEYPTTPQAHYAKKFMEKFKLK